MNDFGLVAPIKYLGILSLLSVISSMCNVRNVSMSSSPLVIEAA